MNNGQGLNSRCCDPRENPLQWLSYVDESHAEVQKLAAFWAGLEPWAAEHELGAIAALLDLAANGKLIYSTQPSTPIKPIRTDPDLYELRHTALAKKLRFYHAEPPKHPDLLVRLHEHIKIDDDHQQKQIDYAASRYRRTAPVQPAGSTG